MVTICPSNGVPDEQGEEDEEGLEVRSLKGNHSVSLCSQ